MAALFIIILALGGLWVFSALGLRGKKPRAAGSIVIPVESPDLSAAVAACFYEEACKRPQYRRRILLIGESPTDEVRALTRRFDTVEYVNFKTLREYLTVIK